jgi:serine/threonine-protein kinase HipA
MLIDGDNRMNQLSICLAVAPNSLPNTERAKMIIKHQVQIIRDHWVRVCDEAQLARADRSTSGAGNF